MIGVRPTPRVVAFTLAAALGAALSLPAAAADNCRQYFRREDPKLFEFVETRAAVDYRDFEGLLIADVDYVVLPIFNENDPRENNWLYRFINRLHIDTRPKTLAKQLTFAAGETLDKKTLQENERLLRDNDYLVDAMILPKKVCGQNVYLLVVARDVWTLTPSASFARSGGENKTDVGVSEDNLLGTGQALSLGRFQRDDRSGYSVSYAYDELFENHTTLSATYSDNSDGEVKEVAVERPFFELDARWAAGISALDETRIEDIESGSETVNTFRQDIREYQAYYGWSRGVVEGFTRRWRLGYTDINHTFSRLEPGSPAPPDNRRLSYPWLQYESIENRFWVAANIAQMGRQEDIPLGAQWTVRLGYANENLSSSEEAVVFDLGGRYTASFGEHHLLRSRGLVDGHLDSDSGRLRSTKASLGLSYHNFIDSKNRWFARVQVDVGKNLNQDEQFTSDEVERLAGNNDGLRGYPNDFQRGNQRWLLTVERRRFTDWHPFQLLRVGGAAYVDIGRVRDTQTPNAPSSSTLANVGFGLRLSPTKASTDKVVHLDIAVPLTEREGIDSYQVIVSGKTEF